MSPTAAVPQFDLGNTLLAMGQRDREAIDRFDRAIRLNPRWSAPYVRRAIALLKVGEPDLSQASMKYAAELDPSVSKLEVKSRQTRYLRLTNTTKEPLQVGVIYWTKSTSGTWNWYPGSPEEDRALFITLEPNQSTFLIDAKHNIKIHASKVRIWARGLKSGGTFEKYRNQDLSLIPNDGYIDVEMQNFDYTFTD